MRCVVPGKNTLSASRTRTGPAAEGGDEFQATDDDVPF
jgi:hypothetical protein